MTVSCRFVYRFKKVGTANVKEVVVENAKSSYSAYQKARDRMLKDTGLGLRNFESRWQVEESELAVGVSQFPEDKDLISEINQISGVESAEEMDSKSDMDHTVYFVTTSDSINEDYVIDKIRTLVEQLKRETNASESEILIIFNPRYHEDNTQNS